MKKIKWISRIDQVAKKTHGWYVRIRFKKKIHSKLFSDMKLGGQEKALKAAIKWKEAKRKELGL